MKNKLIYIILASTCIFSAKAQQEAHFTQFADNQLFVNPAYAGSNEILNATVLHRQQWVGFTGAPQTSTFSMHSPLSYESVGLGVTMVSDQIGPLSQNMIYGDFSYTLRFNNQTKLAFGLKAGMNVININSSELNTTTENDPSLMKDVRNQVNPNLGFGVYFHSKNWFFGASSPKLFESSYDGTSLNMEKRHFFVNAGTILKASSSLKLRPLIQAKFTEGAPLSLDAAMTAIVQEKVFIGAMYRLNSAGGFFVQYQLAPTFRIGLGTEIGLTEIRKYNDGTFELMLSYDLTSSKSGIKSPRYF